MAPQLSPKLVKILKTFQNLPEKFVTTTSTISEQLRKKISSLSFRAKIVDVHLYKKVSHTPSHVDTIGSQMCTSSPKKVNDSGVLVRPETLIMPTFSNITLRAFIAA